MHNIPHTEAAKAKMSIAQKKRYASPEARALLSSYRKGKKMPASAIERIRAFQKRKVFSPETRKKISDSKSGANHHWWRGGVTAKNWGERKAFMNTYEYKLWRKSVFERDNYTCIECNVRGGELNADHIKSYSQYPELRLTLENGRTLCRNCHKKVGWKGNQHK